uniref:Uncharacterized protein n=1 Tax=Tetradesmus obliquus TaxID=3088 RepID=A0A383V9B6_TETOB|eukprot:jgi/Sobl393_1/8711/SZX60926.1
MYCLFYCCCYSGSLITGTYTTVYPGLHEGRVQWSQVPIRPGGATLLTLLLPFKSSLRYRAAAVDQLPASLPKKTPHSGAARRCRHNSSSSSSSSSSSTKEEGSS